MSFNVLVIPEDPTLNGHILKPLAERVLKDAGKPKARVKVLDKPRVRGYDQAVKAVRHVVAERYGFVDLCLFFPDADRAGARAMQDREAELRGQGVSLSVAPRSRKWRFSPVRGSATSCRSRGRRRATIPG